MVPLRVRAPFAAFRTFTAGAYRPTAPFLPPSAAYGLLLYIAGIDSRLDDGESPMTLMRTDLPRAWVAVGEISEPERQLVFQQLHNYPVGEQGKERREPAKGYKYNIQLIRREFLSDLDACIVLDGNPELEERVRQGLELGADYRPERRPRYGIPFVGDNNFFLSRLEIESAPLSACWYERLPRGEGAGDSGVSRLTVWIDRKAMANTYAPLFRRAPEPSPIVPATAWVQIPPENHSGP